MDQAKAAISNIIGRGGAHDTTVDETVNAPVTSETVKPTRHEETTTAIDKEVHQDHYHTTVQPLSHQEVLPEQHTHQMAPVQEREFHHGDSAGVQQSVQAELGQFTNTSQTAQTAHTASQAPTAAGEHIHHHVHEQVQPVIHKETVQPEVVHTVVPVHERHQAPSEHHGMSTMPIRPLEDFQNSGILAGSNTRHETYEGDPRKYNPELQVERHDVDKNFGQHDGLHGSHGQTGTETTSGSSHAGVGVAAGVGAATAAATGAEAAHHHHQHHHERQEHARERQEQAVPKATAATVGQEPSIRKEHETAAREGTADSATVGSTTEGSSTLGASSTHTGSHHHHHHHPQNNDGAHPGHEHVAGHGITNQQHHGTALDNTTRDDSVQHGDQPRDPAMVDDKTDKKLTGTGVDGSHSAVFGLTPDGHKHDDTSHGSTPLKPAHSKETSDTTASTAPGQSGGAGKETVADQMTDPRVAEKGHGGPAVSATGSGKPGAGLPSEAGSQGLGEIRPSEHGAESKLNNKLDPTTDADGDGKKGVMD